MNRYLVREPISADIHTELAAYPELIRTLLFYRGIKTAFDADTYLNPNFDTHVHDPFLIKGMEKAVERILRAIDSNEKIIVYSDYDADGIPGAVVMHDFLQKIGYKNFEVYIPHRHLEGYGLHMEAIDLFKEKGTTLLITIDCGITDIAEVAHANELGIEVIVTDHHLPGKELPAAYAIINSKQEDCAYPYKMLCGSGVVFKLVQAVLKKRDFGLKAGAEKWFLDMVGIATCADMVPLQGENRVFAQYGLKVLRKSPRLGLMKMLRKMKVLQAHVTEDDIGFMIAPRINAASRMGVPLEAFKLLTSTDETETDQLSTYLQEINDERKGIVAAMVKEIHHKVKERPEILEQKVFVMGNPNWKPSLLGLAASAVVEEYKKPVFLWGREGGDDIKGSCRSDGTVNLVEIMQAVQMADKDMLTHFGGHMMAGGFAVNHERLHLLEAALNVAYEQTKITKEPDPIFIDAKISIDRVNWQLYRELEKLQPFGLDNAKPLFLFEKVVVKNVRMFGKKTEHLEISIENGYDKVNAIGFFMKPEDLTVVPKTGDRINLVGSIEKSMFMNRPELRLRIEDVI